jgi:hypothetical protein
MNIAARRRLAFSLIEVMVALAIFFACMFAILGLISQLLQNARAFQTKKAPHVSLVHGWWTSKTNRVVEGLTTVEFNDIATDLGELYRDYYAEINAEPDPDITNGLWDVTYKVYNRRTRQVESEVFTLYWDPNSQSKQLGGGIRR